MPDGASVARGGESEPHSCVYCQKVGFVLSPDDDKRQRGGYQEIKIQPLDAVEGARNGCALFRHILDEDYVRNADVDATSDSWVSLSVNFRCHEDTAIDVYGADFFPHSMGKEVRSGAYKGRLAYVVYAEPGEFLLLFHGNFQCSMKHT
jgi:hypothetical protein